jgi:putative membrane protein
MTGSRLPTALLAAVTAVLVWSGILPRDRGTWLMEVAPVLVVVPILAATHRRFPLTPLLYLLIALHAAILCVGGHYTYAEVPAGFWFRDLLGLSRNHYDRLGHFMQGFMPAILAREILLRKTPLRPGGWLNYIVISICLAFSAFYEFTEWWTALATGAAATDFLGTQGDPWDTQWDMFLCLIGATTAVFTLPRFHNNSLRRIAGVTYDS